MSATDAKKLKTMNEATFNERSWKIVYGTVTSVNGD